MIPLAVKISMYGPVSINAAMGVIYFTNRVFDFIFMPVIIISLSIFKVIIISIGEYIELPEKPSQPEYFIVFLNKSISL